MPTTRSAAKIPKPPTAAAGSTAVRRRSPRFSQSKTESPSGPPGVRKNAKKAPKTSTRVVAIATPTCSPRRAQRLLQTNDKSSHPILSGCGENVHNMPETITSTVIRRSQRLLQSKTGSGENAQTASETTTATVLRRSQRLLKPKTGSLKSRFSDGNTGQGSNLFKKSSVRRVRKSILPVNIEAVRLNFDDVGTIKCNDPIRNSGIKSEKKTTHRSQNGQRKSGSRTADTDVEVLQQKDYIQLPSLAVDIGKIIEKDDDARKSGLRELEGILSELDSPHVSKLQKRCIRRTSKCKKQVGTKRKQKQSDDAIQGTNYGWTKEQENALQRAYFAAKPTPNFWKRVARLVPGKSSQECFDKVDSENLTPPVSQPRSRCKQKALSPQLETSFLGSELLSQPNSKRKSRRKKHVNQKTVRNLMRKNSHMKPGNQADLFSVLEPTVNLSPKAFLSTPVFLTPTASAEKGSSPSCRSHFLSSQKKSKSRFSGKSEIPIASPPVLKPVRNIAKHDKYVDQLHAREAKRKTASTALNKRSAKIVLKNNDVVRAAKESLLSDAQDVITKFRHSQIHIENGNDSEEDYIDEDEDEDNDAL